MEKMLGNGRVSDNHWALVLDVWNMGKINAWFLSLVHLAQSYLCFPKSQNIQGKSLGWVFVKIPGSCRGLATRLSMAGMKSRYTKAVSRVPKESRKCNENHILYVDRWSCAKNYPLAPWYAVHAIEMARGARCASNCKGGGPLVGHYRSLQEH